MSKTFNTEGQCDQRFNYMVDINKRLGKIKRLVDRNKYFVINRARQFGKTTTLMALTQYLQEDYITVFLDFQKMSSEQCADEHSFSVAFAEMFLKSMGDSKKKDCIDSETLSKLKDLVYVKDCGISLGKLFECLSQICGKAKLPIALIIDEVDSATNNQVFLDFLAQLRGYYIGRLTTPTFQSVILASVYDIKNLKLKIRPESDHKYNSPWNIAASFRVDMSFSAIDIAGMLREYEDDNHTGMNVERIAAIIYKYTSGYPFLVSLICKMLDEEIPEYVRFANGEDVWTEAGIAEAVKTILKEPAPLFENMIKQLDIYPDLRTILSDILYQGKAIPYSPLNEPINIGVMFGFLIEKNGQVAVSNRLFEMALLNLFISEEASKSESYRSGLQDKNQFIKNGLLDMDLVMAKFVRHYTDVFGENDERFMEEKGRKMFLLYIKPIINGIGNSYMEAETRDMDRTDVIIDYLGQQYIIELKIWRGDAYNTRGEDQISGYLDAYHQKKGYMLSFNFNKKKEVGVKIIQIGDKTIVEAVV